MSCIYLENNILPNRYKCTNPNVHGLGELNLITIKTCNTCIFKTNDINKKIIFNPKKLCINLLNLFESKKCNSCNGNVKIKVFNCIIHDKCTINKEITNIVCCKNCPSYKPN
jgi:hypothetical protein